VCVVCAVLFSHPDAGTDNAVLEVKQELLDADCCQTTACTQELPQGQLYAACGLRMPYLTIKRKACRTHRVRIRTVMPHCSNSFTSVALPDAFSRTIASRRSQEAASLGLDRKRKYLSSTNVLMISSETGAPCLICTAM
jgi:hypothetical protein